MAKEVLLVLSTFGNADEARRVARLLVEERLAACVNVIPAIESIYRWEEKVETATEVLVLIKTTSDRYPALEARIKALHSYELPEVLAFRAHDGLPGYLRWVEAC
ncbi:MAG: divalent-cation tolerance protein CutA [Chthoniobacteraceae bacterium]|nr:divalent-cation tolerance protein CutA [Chthoniobacteraceae bacterium]